MITILSLTAAIALPYTLNAHGTTSINDNVSISIDAHCSFRSTGTAVATDKSFEANGFNGREVTFNDGGKHDFNILCNHETGYTIKAYATDLINDDDKTIPFVNFTNYITEGNNSNWTAEITNGSAGAVFGATEEDAQAVFATNTISADQGENFSVTYKAYVGATATPGTYSGTATYILSTNPLPDPTPVMPTFQTFTTARCNDIPMGDTIEVKDERDQKTYLVSRLKMSAADTVGKCWMVQNLALDQGQELTPANSDISSNYVIPSTTAFNTDGTQDAIVPSHSNAQADSTSNTGGYYSWNYGTATPVKSLC